MAYSRDLYQQVILDHNQNPRNYRELPHKTHQCEGHNPLCGDNVTVYVHLNDQQVCEEVSFLGSGCAISKASCSFMTTIAKGKSIQEIEKIFGQFHKMVKGELNLAEPHDLGKLTIFEGVKEYPARVKCATLAWHALTGALHSQKVTSTETENPLDSNQIEAPVLDLTGVKCPINYVKTKVRLSKMEKGEKLFVILDSGNPIKNVSKSLEADGESIHSREVLENGQYKLLVEKNS